MILLDLLISEYHDRGYIKDQYFGSFLYSYTE